MERPKNPRAKFHFTVRYNSKNGKINVVLSKNISKGGILVTTDEKLELGLNLKLKINLPKCGRVPLAAEVVRCKKIPKPGKIKVYNTAFKFIYINYFVETLDYIDNLVKEEMSQF